MLIKLDTYKGNATPDMRSKLTIEQNMITETDTCIFGYAEKCFVSFVNNAGGSFSVNIPTKEKLKDIENQLYEHNKVDLTDYYYILIGEDCKIN